MLLKHLNPTDLSEEVGGAVRSSLVLVTGSTGVGKSYLVDSVCSELRVPWIDLESFGKQITAADGRTCFYVDVPALVKFLDDWEGSETLLVGYCDNLSEVVAFLSRSWLMSFYVVTASAETHKRICLARYFECKARGDEMGLQQKWYARSRMPVSRLTKGMAEAAWGHLCTFAYGLWVADELVGAPKDLFPKIDECNFRWRKWAAELVPQQEVISQYVAASTYKGGLIVNSIPEKVHSIKGWCQVKGGIKHG